MAYALISRVTYIILYFSFLPIPLGLMYRRNGLIGRIWIGKAGMVHVEERVCSRCRGGEWKDDNDLWLLGMCHMRQVIQNH